jgi:FlaA1/EpsC-like NDP-sugar epimerase
MTRWFISVQELVKEILKEKTTGLYIPDKMKSYKMIDIAEYIAKTYGNKDTQIIITGGRPGERLYEYLGGESSENNTGNINDIKKLFNDTRTGILA